jgi:hypothetical protein
MSQRPTSPSDLVQAFQGLTMSTTSRPTNAAGAQAAQAAVKVRTPDIYQGDREKFRAFIS